MKTKKIGGDPWQLLVDFLLDTILANNSKPRRSYRRADDYNGGMKRLRCVSASVSLLLIGFVAAAAGQSPAPPVHPIVLHAARLLDIRGGHMVKPGEVLVQGERIIEVGTSVKRPAGPKVINLGDARCCRA
jgi:hypothetical protein